VDSELPLILLNSKRAHKSTINGEEMPKEPVSDFIFDKRDNYRVQINCMWDDLSYSALEYSPEPLYECWIKSSKFFKIFVYYLLIKFFKFETRWF
jgi:hypothetical protein